MKLTVSCRMCRTVPPPKAVSLIEEHMPETRNFEPSDWDQVQRYLIGLGLGHLVDPIDALGVDSMEDFCFLYREDLMEAGALKEEAELILGCANAERDGRSNGPGEGRTSAS